MTENRDPVRFAVIGCGVIGEVHVAAISSLAQDAEFVLAVDENIDVARALAGIHGATAVESVEEALARPDVDAVAICTPSGTHAELAVAAMQAGKHVVVEKPLDVTLDAAYLVADAQLATGRAVTVISQHRFDVASEIVHVAVQNGRLGRLTSGVASIAWWRGQDYYDSGGWRGTWALDGGGALMNQGIHTIDLLMWMLGEPIEVFAWTRCLAHERVEVEDTAAATIRFANGALGVVHGTTAAYPGLTARLQLHGDRGSAIIDGDQLVYFHTDSADSDEITSTMDCAGGRTVQRMLREGSTVRAGSDPAALSVAAHANQYRDFVDAVRNDRPPRVTVADGIRTVAVIRALYQSARTGRPVRIDPLNETAVPEPDLTQAELT